MKKYIIISGFNISDNNRGTAALSYGSVNFCVQKKYLVSSQTILTIKFVLKKWKYKDFTEKVYVDGVPYVHKVVHLFLIEKVYFDIFNTFLPFGRLNQYLKNTELVAALNGGDGFSDIYGMLTFKNRLNDINYALKAKVPIVILPQTIGPFECKDNLQVALNILKNSKAIYVRDEKFIATLCDNGLSYTITKDLSAYMLPEPWNMNIPDNSIGINISGLCYSNSFRSLCGQFEIYPELIDRIINHFRDKGHPVFLIPHSYNIEQPVPSNDDMVACKEAYERLTDKSNVIFLNFNLISPQVKYVISRMKFFIGTRMHANFAAIYTKVPVFGLAYSYKFEGAFNNNEQDGEKQTYSINNLKLEDIPKVISKIDNYYNEIK